MVEWSWNFVARLKDGMVLEAWFTGESVEESVESEFAYNLKKRLERYFKGRAVDFDDVNVRYPTPFSERVLRVVRSIPFGMVESYSSIAEKVGTSPRAVGVALRMNLVPVIVPCHRVVSKAGIGGYSQGEGIKKALLELESKFHGKL
ncbi:Methylated-DNA--protein-cysteine methyltransferase [Geoglobus acetivorans]|uniref:Methylated-DNA--protein-cysteine methyltransferase n=1 Tax=Geoglobus acetivorans TaxID=565033 RepID=A0A0A7GF07_GEOAI|nr:Methylated-DNA--protein-cysteine methyltransferase [Geoglobus acetivorans]